MYPMDCGTAWESSLLHSLPPGDDIKHAVAICKLMHTNKCLYSIFTLTICVPLDSQSSPDERTRVQMNLIRVLSVSRDYWEGMCWPLLSGFILRMSGNCLGLVLL